MVVEVRQIKELEPGTIVEIPESVRSDMPGQKYAVFIGAEYASDNKALIFPKFRGFKDGKWLWSASPMLTPESKLNLAPEDVVVDIIKAIREQANAETLSLPLAQGLMSGTDPEIFAVDGKGQVLPAWEFLPDKPHAIALKKKFLDTDGDPYIPMFWDGVQAEFCPQGRACLETLHDHIRLGLMRILKSVRTKYGKEANLTLQNTVQLTDEIVKTAKEDYLRFRCSPSMNIYHDPGSIPPDHHEYRYRFAGGHIHIGFRAKLTAPIIEEIVKALDNVLAIASVSMAAGIDTAERRKMYGRAGEFRLPPHGIEYRVLSNFWLSHPAISNLIFELTRQTVKFAMSGLFRTCWASNRDVVRDVINNNDVAAARKILDVNKHVLTCMLKDVWGSSSKPVELGLVTILNGLDAAIKDPTDIVGNWDLEGTGKWLKFARHTGGNWASQAAAISSSARLAKALVSTSTNSTGQ